MENFLIRSLGSLRLFLGQLVAGLAKMDLHVFPVKPVAVFVGENHTAMKAFELIFTGFSCFVIGHDQFTF